MSEEVQKAKFKTDFLRAHIQATKGCGRNFCLNPNCAAFPGYPSLDPNQAAAKILSILKSAPNGDIEASSDFFFCPEPTSKHSIENIKVADSAEIRNAMQDLKIFGLNFIPNNYLSSKNKSIDWEGLSNFFGYLSNLCQEGILDNNWLYQAIENYPRDRYSSLYIPRIVLMLLFMPELSDIENYNTLAKLAELLCLRSEFLEEFSFYIDDLDQDKLQNILWNVKQFLLIKILDGYRGNKRQISYVMQLTNAVYLSNERNKRLDYKEFYNDAVNIEERNDENDEGIEEWKEEEGKIDIREEYKAFLTAKQQNLTINDPRGFSFAFYPWILDANTKSTFLQYENKYRMLQVIHNPINLILMDIYAILEVRRDNLIEDTLSQISSGRINFRKPLRVIFLGEEGIDAGGVKKEFFQLVIKELFDPSFSMFNLYLPQRIYWFNPDTLEAKINFELIGLVLGLAIYNGVILDIQMPLVVYKKLLGIQTTIDDLRELDPDLVKQLEIMLQTEENVEEVYCRNFILETKMFDQVIVHELKENGSKIPVTNENRQEFVDLYVDWWLNRGISEIFEAFKRGFFKVCEGDVIHWFKPKELELLICGNPVLDFFELEKYTKYEGFNRNSKTVIMFWEIVHSFTEEEKRKFLKFVTGSDRAPINGLGTLEFVISRNGDDSDRLMTAHTCFNHLLLPEYSNKETMRKLILLAIDNAEGFGLR
ncbi:unnamed protein product [Blepharisma stoltei]|uniref:HECT-type E3 ubiquitin transferase n=1 Tax=Blepharisma stoltei TaxID=1481888 RepID=A0AAU9J238_9CILI|nr:unnamed protein product [Blepharisma stoltei]